MVIIKKIKVTFYTIASGKSPILDYIADLPKLERARILEAFDQIEQYSFDAIKVRFRQIEGKLWEIKVATHRIFYVRVEREEIVMLHAYKKQSKKLPHKEREVAMKRMKEVLL